MFIVYIFILSPLNFIFLHFGHQTIFSFNLDFESFFFLDFLILFKLHFIASLKFCEVSQDWMECWFWMDDFKIIVKTKLKEQGSKLTLTKNYNLFNKFIV